jgi:hypothetical protein
MPFGNVPFSPSPISNEQKEFSMATYECQICMKEFTKVEIAPVCCGKKAKLIKTPKKRTRSPSPPTGHSGISEASNSVEKQPEKLARRSSEIPPSSDPVSMSHFSPEVLQEGRGQPDSRLLTTSAEWDSFSDVWTEGEACNAEHNANHHFIKHRTVNGVTYATVDEYVKGALAFRKANKSSKVEQNRSKSGGNIIYHNCTANSTHLTIVVENGANKKVTSFYDVTLNQGESPQGAIARITGIDKGTLGLG